MFSRKLLCTYFGDDFGLGIVRSDITRRAAVGKTCFLKMNFLFYIKFHTPAVESIRPGQREITASSFVRAQFRRSKTVRSAHENIINNNNCKNNFNSRKNLFAVTGFASSDITFIHVSHYFSPCTGLTANGTAIFALLFIKYRQPIVWRAYRAIAIKIPRRF